VREVRDEERFDSFFNEVWPRLQGQAYALTGSRELAQDLTQEALFRAWRNWDTVAVFENPEAWARKVLHNLCIASWRKTRRQPSKHQTVVHSQIPEPHEEIAAAMRSLPGVQARALLLHDGLGMTVSEVAEELKAPEGTVKSWLSRSRKVVASHLERLERLDREPTER
jgi:RNA polymerase sigma-70 factor (ECF subfamily)